MRLPGSEKLEIIRLVEQSHLPARRTLEMLGVRPSTFYRWYDRYRAGGPEALEDKSSKPDRFDKPAPLSRVRRPCAPKRLSEGRSQGRPLCCESVRSRLDITARVLTYTEIPYSMLHAEVRMGSR